jgi:hypothetical protein
MVSINAPGWSLDDIMVPVTYYEDGCSPCDHMRTSIEVIMMTFLGYSPEMQQKPWTKMCLGYINNTLRNISDLQLRENLMLHAGYKTKASAEAEISRFMTSLSEVSC